MIARLSELVKNCLSKKAKGEKWLPPVMTHAKVIAHTEESNEHADEHPKQKRKRHLLFASAFSGGGSWIRTSEVMDNRFTVCPLWPLGNSPIFVC